MAGWQDYINGLGENFVHASGNTPWQTHQNWGSLEPIVRMEKLEALLDSIVANGVEGGGGQSGAGIFPTLRINTEGLANVVSKEDYLDADYVWSYPDGTEIESGTLRIRGRGNYTWTLPKKPYRLNFDEKTRPLDFRAEEKNWALLANHDDPRKMGYGLGLTLAFQMEANLGWTPEYRMVEFILNNVYQGLYMMTDLWRIEDERVPGDTAEGLSSPDNSGTWLAEISRRYISDGDPGFTTSRGVMIQFEEPEVDLESADAEEESLAIYFQNHIQAFEDALYSEDFLDPETGYRQYVDMRSFATWYLISEFGSSQDSNFESSIKLWKERDSGSTLGKLHMGIWDMSISFGLVINASHDPDDWYTWNPSGGVNWINRMWSDPLFYSTIQEVWTELRALIPGLLDQVQSIADSQYNAIIRDTERWTDLPNYYAPDVVLFTRDWITRRELWMDENLPLLEGTDADEGGGGADITAPSAPTSLNHSAVNSSSVTLTWAAATDNVAVTGYRWRRDGGSPTAIGNVLTTVASGLTPETEYDFEVAARDAAGNWGPYSSVHTVSTTEVGPGHWEVQVINRILNGGADCATFNGDITSVWDGNNVSSTDWNDSPSYSIKNTGSSTDSYIAQGGGPGGGMAFGMEPEVPYVFVGVFKQDTIQTGDIHARARALHIHHKAGGGGYSEIQEAADNTTGVQRVVLQFTLPAGTTEAFIRIYNGNGDSHVVYWDSIMLYEGTEVYDYFDGNTPDTSTERYSWEGVEWFSPSIKEIWVED